MLFLSGCLKCLSFFLRSVAEHHPQFGRRAGRDGPLPLHPAVGDPEPAGASHENPSGLLQPGERRAVAHITAHRPVFPACSPPTFHPRVQEQRETLITLRQAAFEGESENSLSTERRRSLCAKEFKKLGFSVSLGSEESIRPPHVASPH